MVEWAANIRPDTTTLRDFLFDSTLSAIVQITIHGRWQFIEARTGNVLLPFESGKGYGFLSATTAPAIILPNTDQPPVAHAACIPLQVTTNAVIGLQHQSTDPDDEITNLTHRWSAQYVDGTAVATIGAQATMRLTHPGITLFQQETSDGLLSSSETHVVSVVAPTNTAIAEALFDGSEHDIHLFGLETTLPDLRDRLTTLPSRFPVCRIAQDQRFLAAKSSDVVTGNWREIDFSTVSDKWVFTRRDGSQAWPVPISASMDTGIPTTNPWAVDILTEIPMGSGEPLRFFNFTPAVVGASKTVGETIKREFVVYLLPQLQRFSPQHLLDRLTNQATCELVPLDPSDIDPTKPLLVLDGGYDVRSEFLGIGPATLKAAQEWPYFRGIDPTSPKGIAENIATLQKKFRIFYFRYRTTLPQDQIAPLMADALRRGPFANGQRPDCYFIGHSMGGLIIRRTCCQSIDPDSGRAERFGDHTKAKLTLATPHDGAAFPTALEGGLFNHLAEQLLLADGLESMRAFLPYGFIPPSPGLRSLAYDDLITDSNGNHPDPDPNPELTHFNTIDDVFRDVPNLYAVGGGTSDPPLSDAGLDIARAQFRYNTFTIPGPSDGLVALPSAVPLHLAQLRESGGSIDPFIGSKDDGTIDRIGFYPGKNHFEFVRDPEILSAIHSWAAQFAGDMHAPVDDTPDEIDSPFPTRSTSASVTITQAAAHDVDGDPIIHAWTIARTMPEATATIVGVNSAMPTITVNRPTNVLLWHVVRDGRGGICAKMIDLFIPADPPPGCAIGRYDVRLTLDPQGNPWYVWNMVGSGCLPQDPSLVILWTNPQDDSTKLPVRPDRGWAQRSIFVYYEGPSINNGPLVFSNVAIGHATSNLQILGK